MAWLESQQVHVWLDVSEPVLTGNWGRRNIWRDSDGSIRQLQPPGEDL
jgi:hypothetical protein